MYDQLFELQANLLKALAHPRRLEIVRLLREQPICVSDMYEMLDLPQANISQHLMILRKEGVVKSRKDGKQVVYSLSSKKILKAVDVLRDLLIDQHQGTELADQLALSMKELTPVVHDPVCGMRVSPATASFHHKHNNDSYYFCASGCSKKFVERPAKYVKK